MSISETLLYYWYIITHYLRLWWILAINWMLEPRPKNEDLSHAIVIIGDSHGLGFGEIAMSATSGISRILAHSLFMEKTIRQQWLILNRGKYHSTTQDWLPASESKTTPKPTLLDGVLHSTKDINAEIFIIMLGSEDVYISLTPEETLHNIRSIATHIISHSSCSPSIYVLTIPTAGDQKYLSPQQVKDNEERNRLISEWLEGKPCEGMIQAGPKIDTSNYEYNRTDIYWKDSRHFNKNGYGRVAKDLFLIMRDDVVKREFKVFRKKLGLDY